jgi:hypothetical protein
MEAIRSNKLITKSLLPVTVLAKLPFSAWLVIYIIALSPIDSVALIPMRPPKAVQKGQVLDPCWTLEMR